MPTTRSLRRSNPITLLLGAVLTLGFLFFLLSPPHSASASARSKHASAASNPLSPPTSPFRKQSPEANGKRVPPPVVHYFLNNVTTTTDPEKHRETILILTPLARFYQEYWDNLLKLTYPHQLISLGFIIPKNYEGNAATSALQSAIALTQSGPEAARFASITILRQDFDPPVSQNEADRHALSHQKERRAAMARARNSLLFTTIGPSTSWVLWLDADVIETPPTLIQDLASHDKPIIVPNCWQRFTDDAGKPNVRPYDYNNWQDSEAAAQLASTMGPDDILLEGYAEMPTWRSLMAKVGSPTNKKANPRTLIPLDGVGGTALLVKAEVHRDGAMFPPFAFYHLIETEGFARMAKRLGWGSWGLPNYFVYHYNE
ncbi:MAG: Golgi mannosyltransferase complex subunit [Vezdaea acicularis]|nr:MAG: Golgi mannosyltransferase complex subunit [Vezdaea acicularis]